MSKFDSLFLKFDRKSGKILSMSFYERKKYEENHLDYMSFILLSFTLNQPVWEHNADFSKKSCMTMQH